MTAITETQYDLKSKIEEIVKEYGAKPSALIMILQDVQEHYNYLPEEALREVAKKMQLPLAQIYGVATYYRTFTLRPTGKHHICVCTGTSCHVRHSASIVDELQKELRIQPGESTPGGEISFETVNCLGACGIGPTVTADGDFYGKMTAAKVDKLLAEVKNKKSLNGSSNRKAD